MRARWPIAGLAALALLSLSPARADGDYGRLDLSRLSAADRAQFWRKLDYLAMEEATVMRCGGADDFAERAKAAVKRCVTAQALQQAESSYLDDLRQSLKLLAEAHYECAGKTNLDGRELDREQVANLAKGHLDATIKQADALCRACLDNPTASYCQ